MDENTVRWLTGNMAEIVVNVRASSPEMARRVAASDIMRAAKRAHIDVDMIEILAVLEVADA